MADLSTVLRRPGCRGLLLVGLYLLLSVIWRVLVEVGAAALLVGRLVLDGVSLAQLSDPTVIQDAMGASAIAVITIIQLVGLGVIAAVLVWVARLPPRAAFGLRGSPVPVWIVGGLGGLTVGFFPGWVAWKLAKWLPWLDMGNLEMIANMLATSSVVGKVLLAVAICVFAPLVEELVFRGFLWDALEKSVPPWAVWLLTSGMFAVYHVDPIHVVGIFFTGLFLGWLRWIGGSVWPAVVGHLVNNGLATAFALGLVEEGEGAPPFWAAVLALGVTLVLAGLGWLWRARTPHDIADI